MISLARTDQGLAQSQLPVRAENRAGFPVSGGAAIESSGCQRPVSCAGTTHGSANTIADRPPCHSEQTVMPLHVEVRKCYA